MISVSSLSTHGCISLRLMDSWMSVPGLDSLPPRQHLSCSNLLHWSLLSATRDFLKADVVKTEEKKAFGTLAFFAVSANEVFLQKRSHNFRNLPFITVEVSLLSLTSLVRSNLDFNLNCSFPDNISFPHMFPVLASTLCSFPFCVFLARSSFFNNAVFPAF